jgi:hypothetical protein
LTAENISSVVRAYRKALTASRRNVFYLNSSLAQLEILKSVGLREEFVKAGIKTIKEEIARTSGEEATGGRKSKTSKKKQEGRAFLFSGYMVDHPSKDKKNFPADKENEIRADIKAALEKHHILSDDRAFLGGLSAGSEIIFAEICAEMGIKVRAFLPLPESAYVRKFVSPGGDEWVERFYKIRNHPLVEEFYQVEHVGEPKRGDDPYERNNRWALYSSLGHGIDKLRLLALWNTHGDKSKDLDSRLVQHMIELTRELGGSIEQISTSRHMQRTMDNVFARLMDSENQKGALKTATALKGKRQS